MKKLTAKQRQILDFIKQFTLREGMAPTVYEIAANQGVKSSTVFIHLRSLQRKNCITRTSQARSIRLVEYSKAGSCRRGRKAAYPKIPLLKKLGDDPQNDGCRMIPFTGNNGISFTIRSLRAVQLTELAPEEKRLAKGDFVTLALESPAAGDLVLVKGESGLYSASVVSCKNEVCTLNSPSGEKQLPVAALAGVLVELRRPLSRI